MYYVFKLVIVAFNLDLGEQETNGKVQSCRVSKSFSESTIAFFGLRTSGE